MSKGNVFENDLLSLIFNGDTIANIADDAGTSPLTNLYCSLHTSDPGEAGNQESNEISYTNYARVAVSRDNSGWTVSGNSVSPAANIDFAQGESGDTGTITHFAVGTDASGTGKVLYSGTMTPNVEMADGVIPRISTETTITED